MTSAWQPLLDAFGLSGAVTPLPSERCRTALLQSPSGRFVLKLHPTEQAAGVRAETAVLQRLAWLTGIPRVVTSPGGQELVEVQANHLFPAQASGEEHEHQCPIAPGSAMGPQRHGPARPAPVAALIETLQPIAQILEALHLRGMEGAWLQWPQAQCADALGRIADREQLRCLDGHPGGEGGQ